MPSASLHRAFARFLAEPVTCRDHMKSATFYEIVPCNWRGWGGGTFPREGLETPGIFRVRVVSWWWRHLRCGVSNGLTILHERATVCVDAWMCVPGLWASCRQMFTAAAPLVAHGDRHADTHKT